MVRQDFPTPPPPTTTSLYSLRNCCGGRGQQRMQGWAGGIIDFDGWGCRTTHLGSHCEGEREELDTARAVV